MTNTTAETRDEIWKRLRKENVGASEVAALVGEHPHGLTRYTLWQQKKGNVPTPDYSGNEHIQRGNYLEPGIAAWAANKWETALVKADVYVTHPTVKGMGCTPDYFIAGTTKPVQIKMVRYPDFKEKFKVEGEVITDAPLGFILQVQQELECLEEDEGWLVVCVGGDSLARMIVKRNGVVVGKLREEIEGFWKSIEEDNPPTPNYSADADTISAMRRAGGGNKTKIDDPKILALCGEYEYADMFAKMWKQEKTGLGAQLLEAANGFNSVEVGPFTIRVSDIPGTEDKTLTITNEMMGQTITISKGRKAHSRLAVKNSEKADEPEGSDEEE